MRGTAARILAAGTAAAAAAAIAAPASAAPTRAQCARTQAHRTAPPIESYDAKRGSIRVFAMQYKQEARNVRSYSTFRAKIECMIRTYVVPRLARGRPNVVVFNEDIGLATAAIGSRGAAVRAIAQNPAGTPGCAGQGFPCATLAALAALNGGYAKQLAYYRERFPTLGALSGAFAAATDTIARGFLRTFSDMARRYRVYIVGSGPVAPFRESRDPADIAALADPDLPRPRSVFVATAPDVYNAAFIWAPRDVRRSGPPMLRNVVRENRKVPLTNIEKALGFAPGPSSGPAAVANLRPYRIPHTKARLGIATSLPAFMYGDPPRGVDPCSDTSLYYMRCLSALGANVVIQDEANPGRWAGDNGWQPLAWMGSTWRAVSDPGVRFDYNVTAFMVGNLADLPFDGQTSITQRGLRSARSCTYVGNGRLDPADGDPASYAGYAGRKHEFLAIAPWVIQSDSRARLRDVGRRLAPGSGDRLENDYIETAVVADLTFPPDPRRRACATARAR
ncbi:MAG: hypothetical protein IRZ21_02890 [Thermoleophilaceae bacterium]|nr:hypothetical protein [Thermoleophilaceae bacterium]